VITSSRLRRPRILVAYDVGAAGPADIIEGLATLGELVFAVNDTPTARRVMPLLTETCEVLVIDPASPDTLGRIERAAPDGVLTFSEHLIRPAAQWAAALGLPHNDHVTTARLTDKHLQRTALREVDGVRSVPVTSPGQWRDAVEQVGLPAVIKPVRGAGSRNTFRVNDARTGAELIRSLLVGSGAAETALLVEEFLPGADRRPYGDYVAVESLVSNGVPRTLAITGKFPLISPFREVGHYWPSQLTSDEATAVARLTEAAVRALGVSTGVTHTELKLTPAGPRVIEVNGRMGGLVNVLATHALGLNLVEIVGRLALGETVVPPPLPADRVTFLHHTPAPTDACRLESTIGAAAVRVLPDVRSYRAAVTPGTDFDASVQTRWLDLMVGQCPDHEAMLRTVESALGLLRWTFSTSTGEVTMTGHDLKESLDDGRPLDRGAHLQDHQTVE
jgi:hypothetical protein